MRDSSLTVHGEHLMFTLTFTAAALISGWSGWPNMAGWFVVGSILSFLSYFIHSLTEKVYDLDEEAEARKSPPPARNLT